MTSVILKQTKIIDPSSPYHLQIRDVKIENGTITQIEKQIAPTAGFEIIEIESKGCNQ